jgi:predicted Zn-ribbon and HTH transcriptional regulator
MTRPPFEVADVIRIAGSRFRERSLLTWPQHKVLDAIVRCRTAALGGHRDQCSNCGHQAISYNSCRNRYCPKCQTVLGADERSEGYLQGNGYVVT